MSTKTLEEIIAAIDPDTMRQAYTTNRRDFETILARTAAAYRIDATNPILKGDERRDTLAQLEATMRKFAWAIEEIDKRLDQSDGALKADRGKESVS